MGENNRGVGNGGWKNRGIFREIENSVFLGKHISFIRFMWTVMLLIYAMMNSGSVECAS